MSLFHLARKLNASRNERITSNLHRYMCFVLNALTSDMAQFALHPFNVDVSGVEVIRYLMLT